jgi:hypothetical protein
LPAKLVAERAGMTVTTLRVVEHGGTGVTIGALALGVRYTVTVKTRELIERAERKGWTFVRRGSRASRMTNWHDGYP